MEGGSRMGGIDGGTINAVLFRVERNGYLIMHLPDSQSSARKHAADVAFPPSSAFKRRE